MRASSGILLCLLAACGGHVDAVRRQLVAKQVEGLRTTLASIKEHRVDAAEERFFYTLVLSEDGPDTWILRDSNMEPVPGGTFPVATDIDGINKTISFEQEEEGQLATIKILPVGYPSLGEGFQAVPSKQWITAGLDEITIHRLSSTSSEPSEQPSYMLSCVPGYLNCSMEPFQEGISEEKWAVYQVLRVVGMSPYLQDYTKENYNSTEAYCPTQCTAPSCQDGSQEGAFPLTEILRACTKTCSKPRDGVRYCGNGSSYEDGEGSPGTPDPERYGADLPQKHLDCTRCDGMEPTWPVMDMTVRGGDGQGLQEAPQYGDEMVVGFRFETLNEEHLLLTLALAELFYGRMARDPVWATIAQGPGR